MTFSMMCSRFSLWAAIKVPGFQNEASHGMYSTRCMSSARYASVFGTVRRGRPYSPAQKARSSRVTLEPMPKAKRRAEAELWTEFGAKRPLILGALLDALVVGLQRFPSTKLQGLPRMADFAIWATAVRKRLRSARS